MKIEFLGVAQIINDLYGITSANTNNLAYQKWKQPPQLVAVLKVTGAKSIPNGIKPYDKTVLPYMRMLNGVNGALQSENPGDNLRALEDAVSMLAETEKNVLSGKQSVKLLPIYPADFAEQEANPSAAGHQFRLQLSQALKG